LVNSLMLRGDMGSETGHLGCFWCFRLDLYSAGTVDWLCASLFGVGSSTYMYSGFSDVYALIARADFPTTGRILKGRSIF
jgi:hypothetical protein